MSRPVTAIGTAAGKAAPTAREGAAPVITARSPVRKLTLDATARQLDRPCHNASFALTGQLLRHQLPVAPRTLPQLQVREAADAVQVFAPPARSA